MADALLDSYRKELRRRAHMIRNQDWETGRFGSPTDIGSYSNKLFGAPFQLLDSVDMRNPEINNNLGGEYLKNFILHGPILYIRPGLPRYTGDDDIEGILAKYYDVQSGRMGWLEKIGITFGKKWVFGVGSRLQRRMYGLRPTYLEYMMYVNYLCRSMAVLLGLSTDLKNAEKNMPTGAFVSTKEGGEQFVEFKRLRWENYRMVSSTYVNTALQELKEYGSVVGLNIVAQGASDALGKAGDVIKSMAGIKDDPKKDPMKDISDDELDKMIKSIETSDDDSGPSRLMRNKYGDNWKEQFNDTFRKELEARKSGEKESVKESKTAEPAGPRGPLSIGADFTNGAWFSQKLHEAWNKTSNTHFSDVVADKIQTLMFMIDPIAFTENLINTTDKSMIESAIDAVSDSIGSEIAFITGSGADTGIVGGMAQFLGSSAGSMAMNLSKLVQPMTGGFLNNLFSGAIGAIQGQKMIYPEIYKSSNSTMDYEYSITLTSPYGDVYNYYMNIIVPLMHLVALAAPRMVTSNSVTSPFLVQAFVPGMCTCQLGIISNMTIHKNPSTKDVSINGFPLTVKVTFQIKELYNALSVSPAHDPASFLFNETLNDYLANLAGLRPSLDMYSEQRKAQFENMKEYFTAETLGQVGDRVTQKITDILFGAN